MWHLKAGCRGVIQALVMLMVLLVLMLLVIEEMVMPDLSLEQALVKMRNVVGV